MEYKKKMSGSIKRRKNGLQKAYSCRPSRVDSFMHHYTSDDNGKRHSVVSNNSCNTSHDKEELVSLTSSNHQVVNSSGRPFFCAKDQKEFDNHEMSHRVPQVANIEANSKYSRLQKMFSVPSSIKHHDIEDANFTRFEPCVENLHGISGR